MRDWLHFTATALIIFLLIIYKGQTDALVEQIEELKTHQEDFQKKVVDIDKGQNWILADVIEKMKAK